MVSFRSGVVAAITSFSLLGSIKAVPLADKLNGLSSSARDILKRSTPAAPYFVAYNDKWINPFPSASSLEGFNVFAITFLLTSGAADQAQNWQELTADQRSSYISEYNEAGISLIVSAFGSTETPTSSGVDPTSAASTVADWVIQYGVNGIDVDYEDFTAFNSKTAVAEPWLITFTQQLRTKLPQGQYILTHAPVAPWFSPSMWSGGGYLAVDKSVGSLIDWYNVQFYNQGPTEYTTCDGLLTASSSAWPQSALFQIAANGVNQDKLLIGKPATTADANNGYIDPSTLAGCVAQAAAKGWNAGVMTWQFPDATSQWITTVRGNTFPVSGGGGGGSPAPTTTTPSTSTPTTPTTTTPSTSTPTTPTTTTSAKSSPTSTGSSGGSGSCAGVSAWSSADAYPGGSKVTYNGDLWTAAQWNQNEVPGGKPFCLLPSTAQDMTMSPPTGSSGAWTKDGAC
ncbi:carbohydrate-binding module family 5 protein [Tylopilus felleus]